MVRGEFSGVLGVSRRILGEFAAVLGEFDQIGNMTTYTFGSLGQKATRQRLGLHGILDQSAESLRLED